VPVKLVVLLRDLDPSSRSSERLGEPNIGAWENEAGEDISRTSCKRVETSVEEQEAVRKKIKGKHFCKLGLKCCDLGCFAIQSLSTKDPLFN